MLKKQNSQQQQQFTGKKKKIPNTNENGSGFADDLKLNLFVISRHFSLFHSINLLKLSQPLQPYTVVR